MVHIDNLRSLFLDLTTAKIMPSYDIDNDGFLRGYFCMLENDSIFIPVALFEDIRVFVELCSKIK